METDRSPCLYPISTRSASLPSLCAQRLRGPIPMDKGKLSSAASESSLLAYIEPVNHSPSRTHSLQVDTEADARFRLSSPMHIHTPILVSSPWVFHHPESFTCLAPTHPTFCPTSLQLTCVFVFMHLAFCEDVARTPDRSSYWRMFHCWLFGTYCGSLICVHAWAFMLIYFTVFSLKSIVGCRDGILWLPFTFSLRSCASRSRRWMIFDKVPSNLYNYRKKEMFVEAKKQLTKVSWRLVTWSFRFRCDGLGS